jgi:soluble lytic murein transglycosylase-like protein
VAASWRNLAEMDLVFARSRRRAAARRLGAPVRRSQTWGAARALAVAVAVFAVAGALVAEAETPAGKRGAKQSSPAPSACPIPDAFRPAFAVAARQTRIPLSLLVAVAYEESRMDPHARSHKGAQGLLQLMPATARELEADAAVPKENVLAGARYLERMLDRFDGNVDLALAAYNAGPAAVTKAGGAPSLETLAYVLNVKARAATLAACG